ncbi:MAG TPA: hypothetical protein VGR01_00445 [Burkholderiales bacterium]|jgi:hypothetical protein|nr:hypothetical protein [Burkholderiales bacterium]
MKLRRALVVLLSLLLLAAQQAVFAHGITHRGKPPPPKEQLAHSNLCAKCVNFEKLAHAVPGGAVAVLPFDLIFQQPVGVWYFFRPRQVAAFHSRAPPVLL